MGWFDDLVKKWRGEASKKAASAAAAAAAASAKKAVQSIGDDFLDFAEGELERARGERGVTGDEQPEPEAPKPRRPTAAEREQRAREELARLKAARAEREDEGGE